MQTSRTNVSISLDPTRFPESHCLGFLPRLEENPQNS
ncbi:rCG63585 [Rattus norvegicus]|uniref:RCG63585 n=1 Tax=Rattus norvegicus TaxID=10116 RepID=A6I528_RAT|nr:rCG63585 [Rattus norvegicus]